VIPAVEVSNQTALTVGEEAVRAFVRAIFTREQACGDLTVAFVEEASMAELNGRYRDLPEPTDVLAFPATAEGEEWPAFPEAGDDDSYLGDVIICPAVALHYADKAGISLAEETGRLLVHGVLHLLGYDHEADQGEMRTREEQLLGDLNSLFSSLVR